MSLFAEQNDLMYAVPGGLIGVGTKVRLKYHMIILRITALYIFPVLGHYLLYVVLNLSR